MSSLLVVAESEIVRTCQIYFSRSGKILQNEANSQAHCYCLFSHTFVSERS